MKHNPFNYRRPILTPPSPQRPSRLSWVKAIFQWKLWKILLNAFKRTCFMLGLLVLISMLMWGFALSRLSTATALPQLPKEMVLFLHLDGKLRGQDRLGPFDNPFKPPMPTLRQMTQSLDSAKDDPAVKALFVRLDNADISLTQVSELRRAIVDFKQSGKKTYIYAPSYGEGTRGLAALYLASAFDERWMQPLGVVAVEGLRLEMPFAKEALDKIGVKPDFYQRKKYKSAYESLTHEQMTPANRQALTAVVDTIKATVTAALMHDLDMTAAQVQTVIDTGLLTAPEALDQGIVTYLGYPDQAIELIKDQTFNDLKASDDVFVAMNLYRAHHAKAPVFNHNRPAEVALIHVDGAIVSENDQGRDGLAAARDIAPAIADAADDEHIKAIIIRINSPGGSPVASDTILRAMEKAKANGKPVIVSMGGMAASGGYWIASGGDYIFAMPMTLTGSIGVVGGKIAAQGIWEKLGVHWDESIGWGENAGMWSANTPFSSSEQDRMNAMLDHIYAEFLQRVATGRHMDVDQVETIAQGRVWTGTDALDKGLVDALGGLDDALDYVAAALGVTDKSQLRIVELPKPRSPIEQIMALLEGQSMVVNTLKIQLPRIMQFLSVMHLDQAAATAALYADDRVLIHEPIEAP